MTQFRYVELFYPSTSCNSVEVAHTLLVDGGSRNRCGACCYSLMTGAFSFSSITHNITCYGKDSSLGVEYGRYGRWYDIQNEIRHHLEHEYKWRSGMWQMLILLNNSAPMPLMSYEMGFDATFAVDIGIQSAIPRIGNDCSWRLIFCCLGQIVLLKGSFLFAYFTYSVITLHDTSISASNTPIN